jgi:hypothetical protein
MGNTSQKGTNTSNQTKPSRPLTNHTNQKTQALYLNHHPDDLAAILSEFHGHPIKRKIPRKVSQVNLAAYRRLSNVGKTPPKKSYFSEAIFDDDQELLHSTNAKVLGTQYQELVGYGYTDQKFQFELKRKQKQISKEKQELQRLKEKELLKQKQLLKEKEAADFKYRQVSQPIMIVKKIPQHC